MLKTEFINELSVIFEKHSLLELYLNIEKKRLNGLTHDELHLEGISVESSFFPEKINEILGIPFLDLIKENSRSQDRHWITSGNIDQFDFTLCIDNAGRVSLTFAVCPK